MKVSKISMIGLFLVALLFVGCDDLFYDGKEDHDSDNKEYFRLPSIVIKKIEIDNFGVKWFGTEKGIVSLNGNHWLAHQGTSLVYGTSIDEIAYSNASGLDELWVGSKLGVKSFKIESGSGIIAFQPMVSYDVLHSKLLSDTVNAIGIDKNNVKYIGTSKGLSILKGDTWGQFMGRSGEEILAKYKISAIATTTTGRIYAATEGGGVSSFKYTDAVSGATTFSQPWSRGLMSDTVYTVIVVEDNNQWYGTNKGAVRHTSEFAKSDWESYTRLDGLICDTVYGIANQSGFIWFGTHRGVSRFNGTDWQSFTVKDGLIDNKINTLAIDKDGSVWFGTDKGISHYINNKWINYSSDLIVNGQ